MAWNFLSIYYGGIGPLYATKFEDAGYVQDLARYQPPHTDGQYVTAMGRSKRVFKGEFMFFPKIMKDPELYPLRFTQLKKFISTNLEPQALTHPTDGQVYGFFSEFTVQYNAEERGGCRVQFAFEEAITNKTVIGADDLRAIMKEPLTAARDAASVADAAFTALRVTVPTELGTFMDAVSSFEEVLNTAEVTTLQLTSSVNRIRSVLQRTLIIPELEDARNYEAFAAIRQMSTNLARAAEYAITQAITIHELEPLTEELTAMDLALQIYGDVDKADQIVRYNPSQYFFYPRGEIIRFSA